MMNSQRIAGSPKHTEALQFCTEGLGFESSDETDSTASSSGIESCKSEKPDADDREHLCGDAEVISNYDNNGRGFKNPIINGFKNPIITGRAPRAKNFPPPLPSLARNGQPCLMMKSYKRDGRFVLQEFKVPSHEVLHAWRCDGRLKLQLVQQQQEEQKDDTQFKCITPKSDPKVSGETAGNDKLLEEEDSERI